MLGAVVAPTGGRSEGGEALGWGLDCSQPGHSLPERGSRLQLRVRGT